jgi:hypothetical protein
LYAPLLPLKKNFWGNSSEEISMKMETVLYCDTGHEKKGTFYGM